MSFSGLHGRPSEEQEPTGEGVGGTVRLPSRAQQLACGPERGECTQEPIPGCADLYVSSLGDLAGGEEVAGGDGEGRGHLAVIYSAHHHSLQSPEVYSTSVWKPVSPYNCPSPKSQTPSLDPMVDPRECLLGTQEPYWETSL